MKKLSLVALLSCSLLMGLPNLITVHPVLAADATTPSASQSVSIMDRIRMLFASLVHTPSSQQDIAIELARQGQYDDALETLNRLHERDPGNQSITRDYLAVLSWAGRDQLSVDLYETLPAQPQPDYVLAAAGHSYRKLNQIDKALAVYRAGEAKYPDSVLFAEGEIRCIADSGDLEGALTKANAALIKFPGRPEITKAQDDITQAIIKRDDQKAVELARSKNYPQSLAILSDLHTKHPDDVNVTRDYLAVIDWAGNHDDQVVALYKTLPTGDQPDYVLEASGHAYRNLKQPENAFPIYQQGWKQYPDSVIFAEGTIRSLADQKKYAEALAMANDDLTKHGNRPEIVDIKKNILRLMHPAPVHKGKAKHHK